MKILVYGDSNTWGYIPNLNGYSKNPTAIQYPKEQCWWHSLTTNNTVFIDGLCGRCINNSNPWLDGRNASETILNDLKKYKSIDLTILQLGTNDCKNMYHNTVEEIAKSLGSLIDVIIHKTRSKIIIISPAKILENNQITQMYYIGAEAKSMLLDKELCNLASSKNIGFISGLDLPMGEDGEHLTPDGHKQLGNRIAKYIQKNFKSAFTREVI